MPGQDLTDEMKALLENLKTVCTTYAKNKTIKIMTNCAASIPKEDPKTANNFETETS